MVMIPTGNNKNSVFGESNKTNFHNVLGATYNLRKELARQIKLVRYGTINVAEALEYTRDLVTYCHDSIMEDADRLQHKIMNQITKQHGKLQLKRKGINCDDIRTPSVKTRDYLPTVNIKNRIG